MMKLLNVMNSGSEDHACVLARKFTILDAMRFIIQSWTEVRKETISACFRNPGFTLPDDANFDPSEENIEESLESMLQQINPGESIPIFEDNLECYEPVPSEDIVHHVFQKHENAHNNQQYEEEEDPEANFVEQEARISHQEALSSLHTQETRLEQQ